MDFKEFWKAHPFVIPRLEKDDAMSDNELTEARALIALYNKKRKPAFLAIKALRRKFRKLATQADAARVYWTEVKRADTKATLEIGKEIGFSKYRVILSPSACNVCRKKTDNGGKVFKSSEIQKDGFGHAPPFHPNCYCVLLPLE